MQWCPWRASVFAAVTAGGRIELWDIVQSVLIPVAVYQREGDPCDAPHEGRAPLKSLNCLDASLGPWIQTTVPKPRFTNPPVMYNQNRSAEDSYCAHAMGGTARDLLIEPCGMLQTPAH